MKILYVQEDGTGEERGSIRWVSHFLYICQKLFDSLGKISEDSPAIFYQADMLHFSLDNFAVNEQLSLMVPTYLIKFCFVLFQELMIFLVGYIGICIRVFTCF